MPQLLFSLAEPRILVLAVLCTSITAYFLTLRDKTLDLRFLIGAFSCWTAHFLLAVCVDAIYPVSEWLSIAEMCVGLIGLVLFVGFAYHFHGNPYGREFRIGLSLAFLIVLATASMLVVQHAEGKPLTWCIGSGGSLALFLWAEGVLIRRWIATTDSDQAQRAQMGAASHERNALVLRAAHLILRPFCASSGARPYRDFALVFLLSVAAVAIYFLRDIGAVSEELAPLLSSLLYLFTLVGFTLVYVNNAPRPTTFRVKIVGASLVAVLAVLAVMWTALEPSTKASDVSYATFTASATKAFAGTMPDRELASRLAVQSSVTRCIYCIVGSALFVLVFFPVFFRFSLVEPLKALLKAVDCVDEGLRDIHLPVVFNDEIGRLTCNFNRMICSLRAAEEDIKCYTESLELKVHERTAELARKNDENERLLLNILPASIADRLKRGESVIADACCEATILFADIVGFTDLSTHISPTELVQLLSGLISDFDQLAQQHGVEKIKTIGDAYMAVAGLPQTRADHAEAAMRLAMDMLNAAANRKTHNGKSLQLRIGINSGPVIAGVIGTHKFAYDLWGDAVNTASRMESQGKPGRIQVTEATYRLLEQQYEFEFRGHIEIKGKGSMPTYFVAADNETRFDLAACRTGAFA